MPTPHELQLRIGRLELALEKRLQFLRHVTIATKLEAIKVAKWDVGRIRHKLDQLRARL